MGNEGFMSNAIHTAYIDSKIQITIKKLEEKQSKMEKFLEAFEQFIKTI
jgi:pheromone shutdown protein TraB